MYIYLGQLELFELEAFHYTVTQDVGGCKDPASTAALLVRDRTSLKVYHMIEDVSVRDTG